MRILHIAPIAHHAEGIGSVLNMLYPAQVNLGHEVRVITLYPINIYKDWPILRVNEKNSFSSSINSWRPDIVIFHSMYHFEYVYFYKELLKENIPYIIQLHGALSQENYKKNRVKKYVAGKLFFNRFLKKAATIIYLNNQEYRNSLVPSINPKYAIIPNGCSSPSNIKTDKVLHTPVRAVFIGRILFIHKGLDVLLDALCILKNMGYQGVFVSFYGNEDDKDLVYLKKRLNELNGIAEYKGAVYGEDKDRVLRDCDFFLLTSRYEGMPMGVLEAISYGVPCLLTPGTNMADEIEQSGAGWRCALSANSIAESIVKTCSLLGAYNKRYRDAAISLSNKYQWTKVAEATVNLYKSIIYSADA